MRFEEKYWYQPGLNLVTGALLPLSWMFSVAARLRRLCFRNNIFKSYRFNAPVIVVGNLTVGGTGKTPCVIALAQYFSESGYQPGIITRGVGTVRHERPLIVSSKTSAATAGDEAVLLARHSQCPVVICVDRAAAARALLQQFPACNLIISDDGLQHYRLQRDIEIAVIDGCRLFGNGRLLPAGPMREPQSRLAEVDFTIVSDGDLENAWKVRMQAGALVSVQTQKICNDIELLKNRSVHAVAGIGNPDKFFNFLRGAGYQIIEHVFPDHHAFTRSDLEFGDALPVLMTEKDAVKCEEIADGRMWYLPITAKFEDHLLEQLNLKLKEKTRAADGVSGI